MIKTALSKIYKGFSSRNLVSLIDQVIASATTFLTSIIVGRACSKDEFGLYTLAFSIIIAGMVLQNSLVLTPYTVFSSRLDQDEGALYLGSTLVQQTVLSGLCIVTLLGIAVPTFIGFESSDFGKTACVLAGVIPFILLKEYARRIAYARLKVRSALVMDFICFIIQVGGVALIAYLGLLSANRAYWITGVASIVSISFWFIEFKDEFAINVHQAFNDFGRSFLLGKWIFISGIVWMASSLFYPWFLKTMRGATDVAIYGACAGVVALTNPILNSANNILEPTLSIAYAKGGLNSLRIPILNATKYLSLSFGFITLAVTIFGDQIIVLIYGIKYAGNGFTVGILACNGFIMAMNLILSRTSFVVDRGDIDFKANFVSMFISFTLGIILVYYYGPLGAAIGLLSGNLSGSILKYISLSTVFGTSREGR